MYKFLILLVLSFKIFAASTGGGVQKDPEVDSKLKVVSLFSGIGGNERALFANIDAENIDYTLACERAVYPATFLMTHYKPRVLFPDINELATNEPLLSLISATDLLFAGFPCQPYSSASGGKPKHSAESEQNLRIITSMLTVIKRSNAQLLVLENVLEFKKNPVYQRVVENLGSYGYALQTVELNSKDCGSLEQRKRLYILGVKKSLLGEEQSLAPWNLDPLPERTLSSVLSRKLGPTSSPNDKAAISATLQAFRKNSIVSIDQIHLDLGGLNGKVLFRSKTGCLIFKRQTLKSKANPYFILRPGYGERKSWSTVNIKQGGLTTPSLSHRAYYLENNYIGNQLNTNPPVIVEYARSMSYRDVLTLLGFSRTHLDINDVEIKVAEKYLKKFGVTEKFKDRVDFKRQALGNIVSPYSIEKILQHLVKNVPASKLAQVSVGKDFSQITRLEELKQEETMENPELDSYLNRLKEYEESYWSAFQAVEGKKQSKTRILFKSVLDEIKSFEPLIEESIEGGARKRACIEEK